MNFKTEHKLTIGLTGGMLCGKSAALALFAKCGALTLSCDELAREISARPAVRAQIGALFGFSDKRALAQKVFAEPPARKSLENLLHPLILREAALHLSARPHPVRVVEAPLLFECDLQDGFDLTVCVTAPEENLLERAQKRGIDRDDFLKRSKAQFSQTEKARRADICLHNGASLSELEGKISSLCRAFHSIYQDEYGFSMTHITRHVKTANSSA